VQKEGNLRREGSVTRKTGEMTRKPAGIVRMGESTADTVARREIAPEGEAKVPKGGKRYLHDCFQRESMGKTVQDRQIRRGLKLGIAQRDLRKVGRKSGVGTDEKEERARVTKGSDKKKN